MEDCKPEMDTIKKGELQHNLSAILMNGQTDQLQHESAMGKFECVVKRHDSFLYFLRKYSNNTGRLTIPISSTTPSVVMIFQFGGLSVYRDKFNPFILPHQHHSLNYFNRYECRTLVDEKAYQNDLTFVLEESFYTSMLSEYGIGDNQISEKIQQRTEFNTIGSRQPMDVSILNVIQNILHCPFKDGFKDAFIASHIKALMVLQSCQFHLSLTGKPMEKHDQISQQDRDTLFALRDFLQQNYLNDTSLLSLSRRFGINEFKLKYGFRKLFNSSPIKYVIERRLELAATLLRNTDKRVMEVANEIGYDHSTNFSIAFRKYFGMSPQHYRSGAKLD